MAPSKWEDEEDSTPPSSPPAIAPTRRKFDDEEDEDDVLDSWDAADDSEVEREKAAQTAAAKAKAEAEAAAMKKSRTQRITEHQADRRRREEEEEETSSDEDEDEYERRTRLRLSEKDADLKHAEDLFGDVDLNRNRGTPKAVVVGDDSDPTKAIDLSAMPLFKPATKDQFTKLTATLIPLLTPLSKKPHYSLWVQEFAKQLVKEMSSADVKKLASSLTTVSNEKMREEKSADKSSKKSKASKTKITLNANRDFTTKADTTLYGGDDLNDDDFM